MSIQNVFVFVCGYEGICTILSFLDDELGKILVLYEFKHSVLNLHHWRNVSTFSKILFRPLF